MAYKTSGPFQFSQRISFLSDDNEHFAPHLHIRANHSKRKTVQVVPYENEIIELRIPNEFTLTDTKRYIKENEQVIFAKLNKLLDSQNPIKQKPISYGDTVPFLGKFIPIYEMPYGEKEDSYLKADFVYIKAGLHCSEIKKEVLKLYGELAYQMFKHKFDRFAKEMNVKFSDLKIDDGRRTFGSYNVETKVIFLSRRLLMMSEEIIDFLIVHELAHADSFPHGAEHNRIMQKILPNANTLDDKFIDECNNLVKQWWI
jgi:predicted metal-dependent hydrolase